MRPYFWVVELVLFAVCVFGWLLIHPVVRIKLMSPPVAPLACWLSICLSVWLYNWPTRARNVPPPAKHWTLFGGDLEGALALWLSWPIILKYWSRGGLGGIEEGGGSQDFIISFFKENQMEKKYALDTFDPISKSRFWMYWVGRGLASDGLILLIGLQTSPTISLTKELKYGFRRLFLHLDI